VIIRELSKQFGVSMDRVRAIIRLKAIEQEMKINVMPLLSLLFSLLAHWRVMIRLQGEPLQTHFLNGMEAVLAVKTAPASARTVEPPTEALNMAGKKSIYEFVDEENVSSAPAPRFGPSPRSPSVLSYNLGLAGRKTSLPRTSLQETPIIRLLGCVSTR
jgi:hypothetical protein